MVTGQFQGADRGEQATTTRQEKPSVNSHDNHHLPGARNHPVHPVL
jgi:hypothetical protein